jgi:hypothetical protein
MSGAMQVAPMNDILSELPQRAIALKTLHPEATFLRILGVNYFHLNTDDEGDLYVTQHGVPFIQHLLPENWYEQQWFKHNRQVLAGTGTAYRVRTRPLDDENPSSIDLVVKWSRVGQDAVLDSVTLARNINAEFNTPFEEFARLEELRRGEHGPRQLRVLTQKPLAIFVPADQMQPWQTGRSRERILMRTLRHPGIEIDVLRAYIMLYAWVDGLNAIEAFGQCLLDIQEQSQQLEQLTLRVDSELAAKGFVVADHKPTHFILRLKGGQPRRRDGQLIYALVDYELLSRTADYEDWVQTAKRREYLVRQKERFRPRRASSFPTHLKSARVFDVDYVFGRAESTSGSLWVVGNDPDLFGYFLPERWRTEQSVRLSQQTQTYYTQTKDRIHLVWKMSRVGELPPGDLADPGYRGLLLQGYNSPFEEFSLALKLAKKGVNTVYPRAIYMTASPGEVSGTVLDRRRFERMRSILSPAGTPVMPISHDYVTIWGYWRGLDDEQAVDDTMLWSPIDVGNATLKGIIDELTAERLMDRHAKRLAAAGFEDMMLKPDHVLICYVPSGSIKTDSKGEVETRQCSFEMMRELTKP